MVYAGKFERNASYMWVFSSKNTGAYEELEMKRNKRSCEIECWNCSNLQNAHSSLTSIDLSADQWHLNHENKMYVYQLKDDLLDVMR